MHCLCVERRNKGIGQKEKLKNKKTSPSKVDPCVEAL
jgi:hypothetical protein